MNEWWRWFKEIPSSVKIKYFIALPLGILLFVIRNFNDEMYAGDCGEPEDCHDWELWEG